MTTNRTKTGRHLTDAEIDALSVEVETADYDVEELGTRRRGRPMIGSGPASVVPVRLDPELKEAVAVRAELEQTTTSDVIREALRRYLDVV
jgi:hypothetical protein